MSIIDSIIDSVITKGSEFATFSIVFPDGKVKKVGDGSDDFVVKIKTSEVYTEIIKKGNLGMGEQYMLGNIDIEGDLSKALKMVARLNFDSDPNAFTQGVMKLLERLRPNNRNNALKNVAYHYDLGNEFYEKWLDKSMTYSCGYFKTREDSIDLAQEQKLEHISKKLMLKEGETLVDIGCGWGSMLIYAAQKYKVKGYGVSLSKEQVEYANKKIKELGLEDLVTIELKDYRDISGQFDKFVSIGMFEHVGKDYYREFFKKVKEILKPEGLGVLHTIGVDRPMAYSSWAWVDKYIFPGAYLPSPMMIFDSSTLYGFVPLDLENLRPHYALTLNKWAENYKKIFDQTAKEKGVEFARMWELYLRSAEAYFEYDFLRLFQLTFSNGINNDIPLTREHIYKG